MNWDALGAISEALGAVVVVASVWYLAIQIRRQTEEASMTATRELARRSEERRVGKEGRWRWYAEQEQKKIKNKEGKRW